MPINAHPEYLAAEKEYHMAQTAEEKIEKLRKMISLAPGHKGAENLRAQLKTRLKKLIEQQEKNRKLGKSSSRKGIKKEDMQAVIVGFTNSGKSSLLSALTNASPEIASYKYTTKHPSLGMMNFANVKIQMIEVPAIDSDYYDRGIVHTADTILVLVTAIEDIEKILAELKKSPGKKIIIFNRIERQGAADERKITATLRSKKYDFAIVNLKAGKIPDELKEKIFNSFRKIRVFTKEPGKPKTNNPIVLEEDSTVKDVAEKILHGFSKKIKESFVTGPSSKFPNQKVGLKHILKDLDVVEFRVR